MTRKASVMCGRYMLTAPIDELNAGLGTKGRVPIPERYNIAPRQPVLVVRNREDGKRDLAAVEWGLVPEWRKEVSDKPLINARMETIIEKPSFRSSIKRKRCLVPFSGWYEWKIENGLKRPYWVRPVKGSFAAFAGVWSVWHGPGADHWLETMAIVTGPATGSLKTLHHRKPLVVRPEDYSRWLQPHDPLPRGFLEGFEFMSETQFEGTPVSTRVNSVRFEGRGCIAPPEEERQVSLF